MAAFDGLGAGVVSIQWLIWKRGGVVPPRFGLQLKSWTVWNVYGVSWMVSKAGWYHGTPGPSFSPNTTRRRLESIISRSVGKGGVTAPRYTKRSSPLSLNAAAMSAGLT